jgi:hypothetical protein
MARQISWRGILSADRAGDGRPERDTWRPRRGEPIRPPASILEAVRAMQLGAVLNVVEVVRAFATKGALRDAFAAEVRRQGTRATPADLDRLVTISLTVITVVALLSAVLWVVMARVTARGSKWGRIIATALLPLALGMFAGGLLPAAGPFARVLALLLLMVGAWAVIRLWHRDSSAYIRYQTTPQP